MYGDSCRPFVPKPNNSTKATWFYTIEGLYSNVYLYIPDDLFTYLPVTSTELESELDIVYRFWFTKLVLGQ